MMIHSNRVKGQDFSCSGSVHVSAMRSPCDLLRSLLSIGWRVTREVRSRFIGSHSSKCVAFASPHIKLLVVLGLSMIEPREDEPYSKHGHV